MKARLAETQDASSGSDSGPPIDELPLLPVIDERRFAFAGEHARGGIGQILEAHDELLGRRVAIKQLLRKTGTYDAARFVREAMVTARLQHPAIVPVYDAGVRASGEPYFAMPLVQGQSLHDAIAATPTLDERLALLPHVQAVADAVAYAHEQCIIHRDLKPANVLVGAFGETAVIDWGLAKDTRSDRDECRVPAAALDLPVTLTATGAVLGTPAYMAPEQADGEPATERSDVYAIGTILFELLTGRAPHGSGGPLGEPPPAIEAIEPGAPRDLVAIAARAMADAPASRYASARELAADLRRFATGQLVAARRYSAWALLRRWLRRHRLTVSVTAVLAIALAVTVTVSARRIVHERDRAEAEGNRLRLLQAEALVDHDPTAAAAWLAAYRLEPGANARTAAVAARAVEGGVARWVLTLPDEAPLRACLSPDASHAIVLGRSGAIWRFDLTARTRTRLGSHAALPASCAFSNDGRTFVSLAVGGGLRAGTVDDDALWAPDLPAQLGALAWDRHGELMVSAPGGRVFAVDVTARRARELSGLPPGTVRAVLDRDGRTLYVVDGTGGVWRMATTAGAVPERVEQLDAPAHSFELARDGRRLVVATRREVYLRELGSGTSFRLPFDRDANDPVIARLAGSGVVVVTARDQTVQWWQPETGDLRQLGSKGFYKTLAAVDEGAAWANVDGSLLVADLDGGRTRSLVGDGSAVRDLDLTPDARWLATTHDGIVRVFSLAEPSTYAVSLPPLPSRARTANRIDGSVLYDEGGGRIIRVDPMRRERRLIAELGEDVTSIVVAPSGKEVAICGVQGTVAILDLGRGVLERLARMPTGCRMVQLLGPVLFAEGMNHRVFQWDFATRTRRPDVALDGAAMARSQPLGASTLPGSRIASIQNDGASIYDAATGQLEHIAIAGRVFGGALAPDENSAVFGMSDGRVVEWRIGQTGVRELARLSGFVTRISFARDGREVFVAAEGGVVVAIRIADGQQRRIGGHAARVSALALSRTDERLASGDASGDLRVYEPQTGAVAVLQRQGAELHWVTFLRDDLLVSLDAAGELRFWPLPRERFVPVASTTLAPWIAALTTARIVQRVGAVETAMTTVMPTQAR